MEAKTPSTSTVRSQKRRQLIRENPDKYEQYKAEQRQKKKAYRIKKSSAMTPDLKLHQTLKRREEQRKYRSKNKVSCLRDEQFTTPQSLGKAVRKVSNCLPNSKEKAVQVISKVVNQLTPRKRKLVIENVVEKKHSRLIVSLKFPERKKRKDALSAAEIQEVVNFYERDDISRMCPGKKEAKSVKTPEGRVLKQKRFIVMSVQEAYQVFKSENVEMKIGKSKFSELRPSHVCLITGKDQEVCMCQYHENISMLLIGITKVHTGVPASVDELVKESTCQGLDDDHIKCIDRECQSCGATQYVDRIIPDDSSSQQVAFYQWTTNDIGYMTKKLINTDLAGAKEELVLQLEPFARHVYNIKKQHLEMKYIKDNLPQTEVVMQVDFAENYNIKHQNEIMSAHWASETVTIYTAVLYYKNDKNELEHKSYAIISNDLVHSKNSAAVFNRAILDAIKNELTQVKIRKVHYWSDGAGSQFKNRFMFSNLVCHEVDTGIQADWSFFETAHGKGPVDGVGGEVKRSVWKAVLQGKAVVTDPQSFFNTAKKLSKKIDLLYVDKKEVEAFAETVQVRYDASRPVPDTRMLHYICSIDDQVMYSSNSPFSKPQEMKRFHIFRDGYVMVRSDVQPTSSGTKQLTSSPQVQLPRSEILPVGQWIAVLYDDEWWPGKVVSVTVSNGEPTYELSHQFKPISENKFLYMEQAQVEFIVGKTYLALLPGDPPPTGRTLRFYGYDAETAALVEVAKNKACNS